MSVDPRYNEMVTHDIVYWRERAEKAEEELAEALGEIVAYGGSEKNGEYDSCAKGGVAYAMRRLAELGKFSITTDHGRRVIGRFLLSRKLRRDRP